MQAKALASQTRALRSCKSSIPAANVQQWTTCRQQQQQQRRRPRHLVCRAAGFATVGAEEAKRLIEREGFKILDIRSARDYDNQHITKPPRSSISAPAVQNDNVTQNPRFLDEVASQAARTAGLIVMCADGGAVTDAALQQLAQAGCTNVVKLEGGYAGWGAVWSPSGSGGHPRAVGVDRQRGTQKRPQHSGRC